MMAIGQKRSGERISFGARTNFGNEGRLCKQVQALPATYLRAVFWIGGQAPGVAGWLDRNADRMLIASSGANIFTNSRRSGVLW